MEDLEKKVNDYIGYPPEVDEGTTTGLRRDAYRDGYEQALKDMLDVAIDVEVYDDWQFGKDPDHMIVPTIKYRDLNLKIGQKVKIVLIND